MLKNCKKKNIHVNIFLWYKAVPGNYSSPIPVKIAGTLGRVNASDVNLN